MAIYALGDLEPTIHPTAYIAPGATVIGNVTIGAQSSVWPGAVLRGDDGEIRIGDKTSVQDGAIIHTTPVHFTIVGNEVTIGHMAHLEGCRVLDGALIGTASVVLHDAEVGEWALVGANAVVVGGMVVPAGALAVGIPAKIREGAADRATMQMGMESYVQRAERFRNDLRRLD